MREIGNISINLSNNIGESQLDEPHACRIIGGGNSNQQSRRYVCN